MWDWITANVWAVWFTAAAALAMAEMLTLDFTLLMLAVGAVGGGLVALIFPGAWLVQLLVAAAVAAAMLFVLRPRMLQRVRQMPGYRSSVDRMVGSAGRALTEITATAGEVKVAGEIWTARSVDGQPIPSGAEVEVFEVDGTVAVVYRRDR